MDEENNKTYAVWVGSLHEKIEEDDILKEFEQCGPVSNVKLMRDKSGKSRGFAFVNFYSREVAEVAANEMNGTCILGAEIKTNLKDESHKKKDIKPFTDCLFYMKGEACVKKDCIYRHPKVARGQHVICEYWLQKSCLNKNCPKRHPHKQEKEIKLTRCDSHGELKCYGQCQIPTCNHNHYFSKAALQDHIMSAITSADEKPSNGSCNEGDLEFQCKEDKGKHSHKPEKDLDDSSKPEPIGIFWDIENCPVPNGKSTMAIVQRIRDVYLPGRSEVEFICVCDTLRQKKPVLDQLNKSEVQVVHVDATSKNAADDKLKQLMVKFSKIIKYPASVLLISGDVNFSMVLKDLKLTSNFNIFLLHNANTSPNLLRFAHEKRQFDLFIADIPKSVASQQVTVKPKDTPSAASAIRTTELLVSNLPVGVSQASIMTRLSVLSDNCGGKVSPPFLSPIDNQVSCVIGFQTADRTDRALVRLDGQDVCGAKITVKHYWGVSVPPPIPPLMSVATPAPPRMPMFPQNPAAPLQQATASAEKKSKPKVVKTNLPKMKASGFKSTSDLMKPETLIPPATPKPVLTLKQKIFCVLEDQSGNWLPFTVFLAKYSIVFKESFNIDSLPSLQKLVYFDGMPGRKFVSLLRGDIRSKKVDLDAGNVSGSLSHALKEHGRKIPIQGIPGLLWSYCKGFQISFNNGTTSFLDFVKQCPNVQFVDHATICFQSDAPVPRKLADFVTDMELLLQMSPSCRIPLSSWTTWYKNLFGAGLETRFPELDAESLLAKIPGVVAMEQHNGTLWITFTAEHLKDLVKRQLIRLIRSKGNKLILLQYLPVEYYKFFGWKLGYNAKTLIQSLKDTLKIFRNKDKKEVVTIRKGVLGKAKVTSSSTGTFDQFKRDLIGLLKSKPNNQVALNSLVEELLSFSKRRVQLTELGFDHPNDLFRALDKDVEVVDKNNSTIIQLKTKANVALEKLRKSKDNMLLVSDATEAEKTSLSSFVPLTVQRLGSAHSELFILKSKVKSKCKLFSQDCGLAECDSKSIERLLYASDDFMLTQQKLMDQLDGDAGTKWPRIRAYIKKDNPNVSKAMKPDEQISLSAEKAREIFCEETIALLSEQPSKSMSIHAFCGAYHKKFKRQYKVANFGFQKAVELFNSLSSDLIEVVKVNGQMHVVLRRLATFLNEAVSLLSDHNGAILLGEMMNYYNSKFQPFSVKNDGEFTNLTALLSSFPAIFIIIPRQPSAVVISKEFIQNMDAKEEAAEEQSAMSDSDDGSVIIESEDYYQSSDDTSCYEDAPTDTDKESVSECDMDLIDFSDTDSNVSSSNQKWWNDVSADDLSNPFSDLAIAGDDPFSMPVRHPNARMKGRAQSLLDMSTQDKSSLCQNPANQSATAGKKKKKIAAKFNNY
eukprot:gene9219-10192_t